MENDKKQKEIEQKVLDFAKAHGFAFVAPCYPTDKVIDMYVAFNETPLDRTAETIRYSNGNPHFLTDKEKEEYRKNGELWDALPAEFWDALPDILPLSVPSGS